MLGPDNPGALVVPIAAPGAGKSTWVARRFAATQVVCLDTYRGELADDEGDQSATDAAVKMMHIRLAERMRRGLTTVVDATNYRRSLRVNLLHHAHRHGRLTVAVVLDVPLDVCLARLERRERKVPPEIVQKMHGRIQAERGGLAAEFDTVVTVRSDNVVLVGGVFAGDPTAVPFLLFDDTTTPVRPWPPANPRGPGCIV